MTAPMSQAVLLHVNLYNFSATCVRNCCVTAEVEGDSKVTL